MKSKAFKRNFRGSALLLVVVLVVLLALMGSTFLFVMRAARLQSSGPGSGNLMQGTWPIVPQSDLDAQIDTLRAQVQTAIQNAVRPGGNNYLLPGNVESSYTHPNGPNTKYLGDRLPITNLDLTAGGDEGAILWRFLSANPNHVADPRDDFYVSQFRVTYPTAGSWPNDAAGNPYPGWAMQALSGRTRFFPALTPTLTDAKSTAGNPASRILAGDADGDGIADCRLYRQGSNGGYDYWVGVRVVDNNGAVNVNTAWRSVADRDFSNTDIAFTNELSAYVGAFRSNIGLYEMLVGSVTENTGVATAAEAEADILSLDSFRFGGDYANLQRVYTGDDAAVTGTLFGSAEHLTLGNAIEYGLARRVGDRSLPNTTTAFYNPNARFGEFEAITHNQLALQFGLANSNFASTQLNTRLPRTSLLYAPNTRGGAVVPQFLFYGANQSDYWYHTVLSTDSATGTAREVFLGKTNNANYPGAFNLANVRKTVRPHLVGENGVSVSAPFVAAPAAGLVSLSTNASAWSGATVSMADYGAATTDAGTPRKVWVNGAPFGELWRAYYNVFKASGSSPTQVANYNASMPTWSAEKQTILRAAIAAINTIQARQPDTADVQVQQVTIGGANIKVFGAKRQPFISEVMVEVGLADPSQPYDLTTNPCETKWVVIELHNPYSKAVDLDKQRFFFSNGTTWTPAGSLAGQAAIPAGGYVAFFARKAGVPAAGPILGKPNLFELTGAAGAGLLAAVPASGVNGNVLRLVTSDGTTADTSNGYDMIPQDEVPFSNVDMDTETVRYRYARHTGGNGFLCVYNEPANGFGESHYNDATTTWSDPTIAAGTIAAANPSAGLATAKKMTIQAGNYGTYKPGTVSNQAFPFNGLARDADILHVAFTGNYALVNPAAPYTCSVGRDAAYAEDSDASDDAYEAVGRFIPLASLNIVPTAAASPASYDWASRLFDFVTATQHPGNEYTPDISGSTEKLAYTGRCVQGKININTASWQTLAALPLVPVNPRVSSIDTVDKAAAETVKLAKAIVKFRDVDAGSGTPHGPFASIFELNLVPNFAWRTAGVSQATDLTTVDLNIAGTTAGTQGVGDLSPIDQAIGDFEQRLLGLTRLSNLLTTRSDSFTVYIVAQAWRHDAAPDNVGVPPIMVGEKRIAFLMDRTTMTRDSATLINPAELKDRP